MHWRDSDKMWPSLSPSLGHGSHGAVKYFDSLEQGRKRTYPTIVVGGRVVQRAIVIHQRGASRAGREQPEALRALASRAEGISLPKES